MENIRPSADLRNKYGEMSRLCRETREPIYITVNGRGDTVLLNLADYRQMVSELELLRNLAEAEEDVRLGRVHDAEIAFSEMREQLFGGKK